MATLVTGGAGYVGSHVVVALHEAGRDAVVVDDFSNASPRAMDAVRELNSDSVPVVEADVGDRAAMEEIFDCHPIDSVVHLAARKSAAESVERPLAYYRDNLASTICVAEVMAERGVNRLVFSSSAAVYGEPAEAPVTELTELGPPLNPYGASKEMGERILTDAAASSGLRVTLLRYFNVAGAHPSGALGESPRGVPANLAAYVMQVAVGRLDRVEVFGSDYDTPDGTAVRDYIHVVDLAEGHVAALDALERSAAPMTGAGAAVAYNLGTGRGHTVLEVIAAASEAAGFSIPYTLAGRRPGDVAAIWADCRRAAAELGWTARRDLAAMMRDHWNWQRRHPHGYDSPEP